MKQTNWWLPVTLLKRLREFQHDRRLDSQREAVERLLDEALGRAGYPPEYTSETPSESD